MPTGFVAAGERPGTNDESVQRLVTSNAPSIRVIEETSSTGPSDRAQNLKLRRRTTKRATPAPTAAVKQTFETAVAVSKSSESKSSASQPAEKSAVEAATSSAAQPRGEATAKPAPKVTAKLDLKPIVPTSKVTLSPATPVKHDSQVAPVVNYETRKKTTAAKPVVDAFADPFEDGDSADVPAKKSATTRPLLARPASKVARAAREVKQDNVDPFADDEPLERFVLQPNEATDNRIPSFEENLAQGPQAKLAPCPSPDSLKRIREIRADIRSKSEDLPPECTLGDAVYEPRQFAATMYHWKASALCHKPLYFEDVSLERYGHSWGPVLQPLVSGGKFFLTLPILPYEMGIEPPCECVYVLGYYRPGSCAPYMIFPVPLSIRGGLLEAGAVVGAVFLIP